MDPYLKDKALICTITCDDVRIEKKIKYSNYSIILLFYIG